MPDQIDQLLAARDYARALEASKVRLAQDPDNPDFLNIHAFILLQQGDAPAAVAAAKRAADRRPDSIPLLMNLSRAQVHAKDHAGALATLERVFPLNPSMAEPYTSAAECCFELGRYTAALTHSRAGLARFPNDQNLISAAATALHYIGKSREAIDLLQQALPRSPTNANLHSTMAGISNYAPELTREQVFEAHKKFGRLLARHYPVSKSPADAASPPHPLTPSPSLLRVGLISDDFHAHPISFFIEPFLANFNRQRFEVFGYYTRPSGDKITDRLRSLANHWRTFNKPTPDELARAIRADNLDLLIELAGHTRGHSLLALHPRPVRRQATYLGYPNTTAVPEVDFRIVDSLTDPAGAEAFATEKLIRLDPCFICFQPPPNAPQSAIRNAQSTITFGSFNAFKKLNDPLIDTWSRILARVPSSRIVLKANGLGEPALCEETRARFAARSIAPDRIELLAPIASPEGHLGAYRSLDIALDTFPYNGTTTTCDALFMGVPVVTLEGAMHAGRVGVSLLTNVGLPDLIARTTDEYIELAATLAANHQRLAHLRATLRPQMLASPLCDAKDFCRRYEQAIQQMVESTG